MTEASKTILNFAEQLECAPRRGRKPKLKVLPASNDELHITLDKMHELEPVKHWVEKRLLLGTMAWLNRQAASGMLKAIKRPGSKEWWTRPEWIEEFNNRWVNTRHAR